MVWWGDWVGVGLLPSQGCSLALFQVGKEGAHVELDELVFLVRAVQEFHQAGLEGGIPREKGTQLSGSDQQA